MNILILGDIMGASGREVLRKNLEIELCQKEV